MDVKADIAIYRVFFPEDWAAFKTIGLFKGTAHDRRDGFIHFSRANQVRETVAKHYADSDGLVLAMVLTAPIIEVLKWEKSRGGDLFPHLYSTLTIDAVPKYWNLKRGPDGDYVFPETIP